MDDIKTGFKEVSEDLLSRGAGVRFRVSGSSMYPLIKDRDVINIEPKGSRRVRYGDIIFFSDLAGRAIVHRVVRIDDSGGKRSITTRGDSVLKDDEPIDEDSALGIVASVEKLGVDIGFNRGVGRFLNMAYGALIPFSKWAYIILSMPFQKRAPAPKERADDYYKTGARNAVIYEEAKNIIRAFAVRGIKTIVLKGLFLADNIYKNIALRPMTDVDILITRRDLSRADRILRDMGYDAPANYPTFLDNDRPSAVNSVMYSVPLLRRPSVHIHWHIINSTWPLEDLAAKVDMERLWRDAGPVSLEGEPTMTLGPEHLVIYLAHHGLHHSFDKPSMAADVSEVIRSYGGAIDWTKLAEEASALELRFITYASLLYVSKVSGLDMPGIGKLRPAKSGFIQRLVTGELARGRCGYAVSYAAYLSVQRGLISKIKFIFNTVVPSRLVMSHNLWVPASKISVRDYLRRIVRF